MRKLAWAGSGIVVAGLLGFWLVYVPSQVWLARREPLDTTPASVGLRYQDVAFPTAGGALTLRGWWMPAQNPKAVLILVHGADANRADKYLSALPIAKLLVSHRLSVLAFDMRNEGTSDATADHKLTLGVDESKDVIGALDFAAARAPGLPLDLMGNSMGGAASIYAANADRRVARLVLVDPVLDPQRASLHFLHAMLGAPRWSLVPVIWSARHFFAPQAAPRDPLKTAEGLEIPVLLVKDEKDPVCLSAYARTLAADNPHITLWIAADPGPNGAPGIDPDTWGTHVAAYRLHPEAMGRELTAFLQ